MCISDCSSDVCSSDLLPSGAARNAVDCALWDLEAQLAGSSVWSLLRLAPPQVLTTALTVSLDTPERMGEAAAKLAAARLGRSEERSVGKEGVSTCRSRWARYNDKTKIHLIRRCTDMHRKAIKKS